MSRTHKIHAARRAQGLCRCGCDPQPGYAMCEECRWKDQHYPRKAGARVTTLRELPAPSKPLAHKRTSGGDARLALGYCPDRGKIALSFFGSVVSHWHR